MKPNVYLILGSTYSNRREIIYHLIDHESDRHASVALYIASTEPPCKTFKNLLKNPSSASISEILFDSQATLSCPHPPEDCEAIFFIADSQSDLRKQIEKFHAWIQNCDLQLTRVITIFDCQLAYRYPNTLPWFEACFHFSDCILLNKSSLVPHKWLSDFNQKLKTLPCILANVKNGCIDNPDLILFPQSRRMSLLFDDLRADTDIDEDTESDLEILANTPIGTKDNSDTEINPFLEEHPIDPYFERTLTGQWVKPIPDIRPFIKQNKETFDKIL